MNQTTPFWDLIDLGRTDVPAFLKRLHELSEQDVRFPDDPPPAEK
jgi:hypothetical protein